MSNGSGRGGYTLKRSPPRQAEDRDAHISHRSTRGTGLPPRILSSGRGKGGAGIGRGGVRDCPIVRPQGGSVPPWAMRGRQVDTYIPNASGRGDGMSGWQRFEKEPPTQPKWDRERSRTPLPHPRMISSSPPSAQRNGVGASLGYSAGPCHQRWMSPHDQAGPSKYSVYEPPEDLGSALPSTTASPSSTPNHSQTNSTRPVVSADEMHKSGQLDIDAPGAGPVRESPAPQPSIQMENASMMQDEKEDAYADSPGAGPSRIADSARKAEAAEEVDVKPDLAALLEAEIPTILDEDREDGVLAVKRAMVLQCYEKNPTVRSTARKAFRAQKTAELSAIGRIVQHVLWRDDGVGVQWKKKARKSKSPTKPANTIANSASRPSIVETSPPLRTAVPPPTAHHTPAERSKTPPMTVKPEPSSSTSTPDVNQPSRHPLPPKPKRDPPQPKVQPIAGPSRLSPIKLIPVSLPQASPGSTQNQQTQLRTEAKLEANKRKAETDILARSPDKAAKQPRTSQPVVTEAARDTILTDEQREERDRQHQEEYALNGQPTADANVKTMDHKNPLNANVNEPPKKKGKNRHNSLKKREKHAAKMREKRRQQDLEARGEGSGTNTTPLPPSSSSWQVPEKEGKQETAGTSSTDKGKGKAREITDLSNHKVAEGLRRLGDEKAPGKGKAKEIVDLTKESKAVGISSTSKPINNYHNTSLNSTSGPSGSMPTGFSNPRAPVRPSANPTSTTSSSFPSKPVAPPIRPPAPAVAPIRSRPPPHHALGASASSSRPPAPIPLAGRSNTTTNVVARPSPPSSTAPRPPPSHRAPAGPVRPSPPSTTVPRPPPSSIMNGASVSAGRPTPQPQYQNQVGQSSYSERQALAALARPPPPGQTVRPPVSKFTPRQPTAPSAPGRPAMSVRPSAGRPISAPGRPTTNDTSQVRPIQRNQNLSSSSPMSGGDMLPLRSITPFIVTPRYTELRQALSEKMEEMDNWTSMLVDLPDRAEMTQRQIDRTRQECFDLQKQMREEKEKSR